MSERALGEPARASSHPDAASAAAEPQIRVLPDSVAAQIAAGEVIERPASVVKELLENALDAGAARVEIDVALPREGAADRISVSDDGCGIAADQLALAFQRHATSKLRRAGDLYALRSYGFRGEALPSIAAAAGRLQAISRPRGATAGRRIVFEAGRQRRVESAGAPFGTTIDVDDLFAQQPARRAFLAGPRAERAAIARVAANTVLARPQLALRLTIDGRTPLHFEGAASAGAALGPLEALRLAFAAIWGGEAAAAALPFDAVLALEDERPLEDQAATLRVWGLAAPAPHHRASRDGLRLFFNARPVQDRRLLFAIEEAYREWLPARRHPTAVAFVELPPDRVDVNVHPTKAQVQLRDDGALFGLLQRALREALLAGRFGAASRPALGPPDFLRRRPAPSVSGPDGSPQARPLPPGEDPGLVPRVAAARPPAPGPRPAARASAARPAQAAPQPLPAAAALPPLRVIGQLRATFIVAEGPGGLVLIDQHAAHERVLYERLLAAAEDAPSSAARQPLLDPALLELSPPQAAVYEDHAERLNAMGFGLEPFGERAVRLLALPAALAAAGDAALLGAKRLLSALLDDLAGAERAPRRFDPAAASAACHGSVRRGAQLGDAAMAQLLRDLERCANPHTCPHGRPTLVEIAEAELLHQFGRR